MEIDDLDGKESTQHTAASSLRSDTVLETGSFESSGHATGKHDHAGHCFVVMPFGVSGPERNHFRGWYEVVIEPAVVEAGLTPVLAAAIDEPNAINDEIRAHLAFDPMVVVDIGGAGPGDPPNPNVMYELGIRHALDLPLVLMAWEGQELPFDISNQRALVGGRGMLDIAPTKRRLVNFISAAQDGRFYRPMQAVHRIATVDFAADELSEQSVLGAVARELRELRYTVGTKRRPSKPVPYTHSKPRPLAKALTSDRKRLMRGQFSDEGGSDIGWTVLMGARWSKAGKDPNEWSDETWSSLFRAYIYAGQPRAKAEVIATLEAWAEREDGSVSAGSDTAHPDASLAALPVESLDD
jgi:hypothetical protein